MKTTSYELLHKYKEFALNFLDFSYIEIYNKMGKLHGNSIDKFQESSLTSKEAMTIDSKLIEEAYMIYECSVVDILNYGDHDIFIGKVKCIHNKDEKNILPTLFMGKGYYETISNKPKRIH